MERDRAEEPKKKVKRQQSQPTAPESKPTAFKFKAGAFKVLGHTRTGPHPCGIGQSAVHYATNVGEANYATPKTHTATLMDKLGGNRQTKR